MLMSGPEKLLALLFLVTTLLSIGLRCGVASLRSLLASRSFLVRAVVANFLVVPLVGLALARFLPLPWESAGAIVLLACVPGGLGSIQFTSQVKGEEARPGAVLVLLNVLAILVSPLILQPALLGDLRLVLPYGPVLGFLVLWILLPLAAGIALRDRAPAAAPRLSQLMGLVGAVAFVAFMIVGNSFRREAVASIGGPAVGAMALLLAASMAAGWILGGPARETRQLLATATSMRNAALCLAIASNTPSGDGVITPLVAFSLLMVPPNLLLTLIGSLRARRAAGRIGAPVKEGAP